jgi:hypothetical protein
MHDGYVRLQRNIRRALRAGPVPICTRELIGWCYPRLRGYLPRERDNCAGGQEGGEQGAPDVARWVAVATEEERLLFPSWRGGGKSRNIQPPRRPGPKHRKFASQCSYTRSAAMKAAPIPNRSTAAMLDSMLYDMFSSSDAVSTEEVCRVHNYGRRELRHTAGDFEVNGWRLRTQHDCDTQKKSD